MDATLAEVPVDRGGHVPGAQVVQCMSLGRVDLAQVVPQCPHMVRVTLGQRLQCAARPDGVELAVVADGDELGARSFHRRQQPAQVGVRGHAALVQDDHVAGAEDFAIVLEAPPERGHSARFDPRPFAQGLGRLARGGGTEHRVTSGLEAAPHGGQGRGLAAARDTDDQVEGVPGGEQALGHLGLPLAQAHAPGELQLADGEEGGLAVDARPFPFGQYVGKGSDPLLVLHHTAAAHTGSRAPVTEGRAMACS